MALGSYSQNQLESVTRPSAPSMFDFSTGIQQKENKSLTRDEAKQLFANVPDSNLDEAVKKVLDSGYTIEGYLPPKAAQIPATNRKPGGFLQGISDVGSGVSAGASQAVGGTLGIIGDFLSAPFSEDVSIGGIFRGDNKGGLGQVFRDETERQQKTGAEAFDADRESGLYKGSKLATGIALSAATPGGVLGNVAKASTLGKIGLGATQGAIEAAKGLALTEGRLGTPEELATGAVFGAALPVIAKGASKAKEFVTERLPESLISTGIATPSKLLNASERLNKLGDPDFKDATSASKWLLRNKVAGDIEERGDQLRAIADASRKQAQDFLKSNERFVPINDQVVRNLKRGAEMLIPKLESAGLQKETALLRKFVDSDKAKISDINKIRTFLADKGGIFKQSGDWTDSLQKEELQNIWLGASKYLDKAMPGFRAANKNYEVASALNEALGLKSAQDQVRQLFSAANVLGAGFGAAIGGVTGDDPLQDALKGGAVGLAGKYLLSPSNLSKIALKLSEFAPKSEATRASKVIGEFVKSRGNGKLPKWITDLIQKAISGNR